MGAGVSRTIRVVFLGFLFLLVQGTFLHGIAPQMVVPNFFIILVVFLSFHEGSTLGALLAFLLGLELDLYGAQVLGPWAGAFCLLFAVLATISQRIFVESGPAVVFGVFVSSVFAHMVQWLLRFQLSAMTLGLFGTVIIEALFTALLAPWGFAVLKRLLIERNELQYGRLRSF